MKIESSVDILKQILPKIERITGKNLTLPALNSILMVASGKTLKLRATNLDIGIEIETPVKVLKEGKVLVSGSILNAVVGSLYGSKTTSIELSGNILNISTTKYESTIKTNPPEDFPTIPTISGSKFSLDIKTFIEGIGAVAHSASYSDVKPEISSVFMYFSNNDVVFVATDSFRLAEKKIRLKKAVSAPQVIIPIKNIQEILRVFSGQEGELIITVSKNQISLSCEGIYLTSRLIDGVFPDYKQIIPKGEETTLVVLKEDLTSALKAAAVFSGKFNETGFLAKPKDGFFEIHTKHQDIGENKVVLKGDFRGEQIETAFNHRYLIDGFQSITDDSVTLVLNGPSRPLLVRGLSDKSFMYLVMPMNR